MFRRTSVVSGLVARSVSVRLSEAASRYCLSASELVAASVESLVSNLDTIEERVRYYGCDEAAWRIAISTVLAAGGVLYEFLNPLLSRLRGEGVLVPTGMTLAENLEGFMIQFASLDPWLDIITVTVRGGRVSAKYSFILGSRDTVPKFDEVLESVKRALKEGVELEAGTEYRMSMSVEAESLDGLKGVDEVASLYARILRDAGVEWLVAEVEHGYPPEKHFELASIFWEHGLKVEGLYEKAVNYLRTCEEVVKGLVKKEGLDDIVERASANLWTPSLLDESVERLSGKYPRLRGAWETAVEVSNALQESRLQHEEVEALEARLRSLLKQIPPGR